MLYQENIECCTVGVSALLPPGLFRPQANIPNFLFRAGFSAIYGGAGYVLSTGDTRNGSGISTGAFRNHTLTVYVLRALSVVYRVPDAQCSQNNDGTKAPPWSSAYR